MIDFLYCVFGYAIGFALYSVGILQIILTHKISVKQTKIMQNANVPAHYDVIYKRMFATIFIWSIMLYISFELIMCFANIQILIGIAIGALFAWLLSLKSQKFSPDNISDYQNTYGRYYVIADVEKFNELKILVNHDTLLYRWRHIVALLLLLPFPVINAVLINYTGKSLGLVPTVLLVEPFFFFIRHWNDMFYKATDNIGKADKKTSGNKAAIIFTTTTTIILLITNLYMLFIYNTLLTENKLLYEEINYLTDAVTKYESDGYERKYNNLIKYISDNADNVKRGSSNFFSSKQIVVVEVGESIEVPFWADYNDATVFGTPSNKNISFWWTQDKYENSYMFYNIEGVTKGCSILKFTNNKNSDEASVLVIVK